MTSQDIRRQFIEFFVARHGHAEVASSPVVPHDDPTLLFTNAGMNQFKPIFLGQERRAYTRAVDTQKCIRAGGKHNDLDDVGRSRRHHTFFEMLGNWSFGDYFKRGAIEMAWELLTQVWKLDPTRLHVTCYEGNAAAGIPRDTEAADIWREVAHWEQYGLKSDDHIHYFGKDNFWEMGDTGPCGPCTEIYVDRTPDRSGGPQVNGNDPRVMEIWNLVFIQYNRTWKTGGESAVRQFDIATAEPNQGEDLLQARDRVRLAKFGTADRSHYVAAQSVLEVLPAQHVDTGMGLERICQVIQGKDDNFATDLWTPLFDAIEKLSGLKYAGLFPPTNAADPVAEAANPQLRHDIAFRVIADHVRCLTFALTDGAVPSNEGRGYVLRRILRRAVHFGRQHLGLADPFLHKLVQIVVASMSGAFPELNSDPSRVAELVKEEEVSFSKTIDRGIALADEEIGQAIGIEYAKLHNLTFVGVVRDSTASLDRALARARELSASMCLLFSGTDGEDTEVDVFAAFRELSDRQITPVVEAETAFKLYDTYGFPVDLTGIIAASRGLTVDLAGYEKLMKKKRAADRAGGKDEGGKKLAELPPAALAQLAAAGVRPTDDAAKFGHASISATVMAIWNGDDLGLSPASSSEDEELAIILDRTSFYAEMGGQVGDSGTLTAPTSLNVGVSPQHAGASVFDVQSTKSVGGYVLHVGRLRSGTLKAGEVVTAEVDQRRRSAIEKNHTTTHLLNWSLRQHFGDGIQQKGSLVDAEKLRFDFSHNQSLSPADIAAVEQMTFERIDGQSLDVYIDEVPQEQALKINGMRAVFGEKYPPKVRVVSIGAPVKDLLADPTNPKWREYSVEFCGGTHLHHTKDANGVAIVAEEAVSKGIRRIVALTGKAARSAKGNGEETETLVQKAQAGSDADLAAALAEINRRLVADVMPLAVKKRVQSAVAELQSRAKVFEKSSKSAPAAGGVDAVAAAGRMLDDAASLGGGKLVVGEIAGATDDQLRSAIDSVKKKAGSVGVLLASAQNGKVTFIAAVTDDLIAKGLKAGDWVKEAAKVAGGSGGGRPQMAQAGGKDAAKVGEALERGRAFALETVK